MCKKHIVVLFFSNCVPFLTIFDSNKVNNGAKNITWLSSQQVRIRRCNNNLFSSRRDAHLQMQWLHCNDMHAHIGWKPRYRVCRWTCTDINKFFIASESSAVYKSNDTYIGCTRPDVHTAICNTHRTENANGPVIVLGEC